MNLNELINQITNIRMKFGHKPKEDVKFSNAEIILLGDFTISSVRYDGEFIFFQLDKHKLTANEITECLVEADSDSN